MKSMVRGVGALMALSALLVGAPLALLALAGNPLPVAVPGLDEVSRALTEGRVDDSTFRKVLALVCWVAWAQMAATCLLEAVAAARGRVARRVRALRPFQAVAATLVTTALVSLGGGRAEAPERRPLPSPAPVPSPVAPSPERAPDPVTLARAAEQQAVVAARHAARVLADLRSLTDPLPPEGGTTPLRLPASWPGAAAMTVTGDVPPPAPGSLLAALAGAGVLAGGIVWSLDRRRKEQERLRQAGERPAPVSETEMTVETGLRAAAGEHHDLVHEALRAFAAGAATAGWAPPLVGVNVAREVSLLLGAAAPEPFPGFGVEDGGFSWVATAGSLVGVTGADAPLPPLVTVGHTEASQVLLNLEAAGVLTVTGAPTDVAETLFSMALELATGPRAGSVRVVVVGVDPSLAGIEGIEWEPSAAAATLHVDGVRTVVVSAEPLEAPTACAVVVAGGAASRWRLRVEGDHVTLGPVGVTLERHRLPTEVRPALVRLLGHEATAAAVAQPRLFLVGAADDEPEIEVRVLGPVDVRGVPEFRRRKALELAAYLATHPKGADSDVLCEALWPGRLVSPATLYAVTSAARRVLGDHFPHASGDGTYRLGDAVALDHARFTAMVADAESALDGGHERAARALLKRALALVRGRPFTTPGGEYLWAHAEAIASAVVADVADAAHLLATLYLDGDDPRGAWWATRQGLMASPGNEQLHRDRMLAADRAGNPAGVEDVMEELCRAIEIDRSEAHEILHPRTVELYERLTRRGTRLAVGR